MIKYRNRGVLGTLPQVLPPNTPRRVLHPLIYRINLVNASKTNMIYGQARFSGLFFILPLNNDDYQKPQSN